MKYAHWNVVKGEGEGPMIIRDVGDHSQVLTVTNDAEWVVEWIVRWNPSMREGRRLLYYDSEGILDELLIEDGKFAGFKVWRGPEPVEDAHAEE